jgi:hypothetical protein
MELNTMSKENPVAITYNRFADMFEKLVDRDWRQFTFKTC